jgi:hypothetical protein
MRSLGLVFRSSPLCANSMYASGHFESLNICHAVCCNHVMIIGTPEEVKQAASQLDILFETQPHAVLVGSLGRAAMYEQFGYSAPPVSLCNSDSRQTGLRDIDVLFTNPGLHMEECESKGALAPHGVDIGLANYIRRRANGEYVLRTTDERSALHEATLQPEVARRIERPFLGTQVWTLTVGTQCYIERLVYDQDYVQKYVDSRKVFAAFVEHMRDVAPDEFLPMGFYAPFEQHLQLNRH